MKKYLQIAVLTLCFSCIQERVEASPMTKIVYTISNQQQIEPLDLSFVVDKNNKLIQFNDLDFKFKPQSGKEIVEYIKIGLESAITIKTNKLGIATYKLIISAKKGKQSFEPKFIYISIISQFLVSFTQNNPMVPAGSVNGINYPTDSLVQVSKEIIAIDKNNKIIKISPGLLVNQQAVAFPHNKQDVFPDFKEAITYYDYKENEGRFHFRYQPLIPMLEVGDGKENRGVGIIVINKNQIMNDSAIYYEFEGYCSIRTRTDAKETYNLGVVIGTMNKKRQLLKTLL